MKQREYCWKDIALLVFIVVWLTACGLTLAFFDSETMMFVTQPILLIGFSSLILVDWFIVQPIQHKRKTREKLMSKIIVTTKKPYTGDIQDGKDET